MEWCVHLANYCARPTDPHQLSTPFDVTAHTTTGVSQ